jgi:hypothetical protein
VWFEVTGDGNTITASTCEAQANPSPGEPWTPGTDFDTKLHVYCLDCQEPVCVAGNDDDTVDCPFPGPTQFHSTATWCSSPGATYRILVSGFGGVTGTFTLAVGSNDVACTGAVTCSATGACCLLNEPPFEQNEAPVICTQLSQGDCEAAGGTYGGDNSACETVIGLNEFHSAPLNIAIPDGLNYPPTPGGGGAPITNVINVPSSFTVSDVNVNLGITHTWIGDVNAAVTSPAGTTVNIWHGDFFTGGSNPCTSTDNINATADDDGTAQCPQIATGPIHSVFYAKTGLLPPIGGDPLANFAGENAQGDWTITVFDDTSIDTGTLNFWGLDFSETAPLCPAFDCPPAGCPFLPDGTCGVGPCQFDPTTGTCNPCPADPTTGMCPSGTPDEHEDDEDDEGDHDHGDDESDDEGDHGGHGNGHDDENDNDDDDDESDDEDDGDDSDWWSDDNWSGVPDIEFETQQGGGSQQFGQDTPLHGTTESSRPNSRR